MEIHLNISFPQIPCELLTLDVMDVSGEQQTGVKHGISKVHLAPALQGGMPIEVKALDLHGDEPASHLDPSYCGECYGPPAPPTASKPGCCQTCEEVREAYAAVSWAFGKGEGVQQCEREHYSEKLEAQRDQGCRIEGGFRVNKVIGNFHIAPGRSFSNGMMHVHDLNNYLDPSQGSHTFTHTIHHLRFGPQLPDDLTKRIGGKTLGWTNHHLNPLDNTEQSTDDAAFNYMYFLKVVSTSYYPLGWESKGISGDITPDYVSIGQHGLGTDGSLETHQYSVTSHKRSLRGGTDEGHKERLHAVGGIPGVFFSYDISPMKVINREERPKTFTGFLTGVCAIIGGTLTVAAAIDRAFYEGATRIKKLHQR